MAQPTQGPSELIIDDGRLIIVGSATHGDIAEFFYCEESTVKTTRDEALANARLFMAAEGIRAALKSILTFDSSAFNKQSTRAKAFLEAKKAGWRALAEAEATSPDGNRPMRVSGAAR